jgi:hypothetical protein
MCRLCAFAAESPEFAELFEQAFVADIGRMAETKRRARGRQFLFSNVGNLEEFMLDFALFEPLSALPNPNNYYQPMAIDGEKLGSAWSSGWQRGIGFTPDGSLLLYAKAVEREPFGSGAEWFKHFFLARFRPGEFELFHSPPKYVVKVDAPGVKGVNLLTQEPAGHSFDFTFSHFATAKSAMLPETVSHSAFYRNALRRSGTGKEVRRSDFEKFMVVTPHFAPHPFFMRLCAQAGYASRFAMQNDVPSLLDAHFSALGAKAI